MQTSLRYRQGDYGAGIRASDDRYFSYDGQWYFTTREGITMGPYDSRAQAIAETDTYIAFIKSARSPVLTVIRNRKSTVSGDCTSG